MTAYPRRCGEHHIKPALTGLAEGLPPQVRGTLFAPRPGAPLSRLTPAGAGNTWVLGLFFSVVWAYPRRCGEHMTEDHKHAERPGLPPQVRGTHLQSLRQHHLLGLTPAGAGNTRFVHIALCGCRAYPRRCGEHISTGPTRDHAHGLPPQVRGTPHCAGSAERVEWAYPRRCGEHNVQVQALGSQEGLPPQVRGTPLTVTLLIFQPRAYPRRCGEHQSGN